MLVALLAGSAPLQQSVRSRVVGVGLRGDTVHIPYTCLGEVWRTLTEPRGYGLPPDHVRVLLRRAVQLMPALMPGSRFNERWLALAGRLQPAGAQVFDVQIAALCLQHQVAEIWTFDAGFPVVEGLAVVNPAGL